MLKKIQFNNSLIRFDDTGSGFPVVLLHGFMESLDVWDDIVEKLSQNYRVIAIDLLGHGQSGNVGPVHTMDVMAEQVKAVLDDLGLEKVGIVGHSMGGYVALEFLKDYADMVECLVLFHSTPFPDTEERKKVRDEMIRKIKSGGKVSLAKDFVKQTFAKDNLSRLEKKIGFFKIIAINTSNDGIIAALEGMKGRPSYVDVLEKTAVPVLWILGAKDQFIAVDVYKQVNLPKNVEVVVLGQSGHQGYVEELDKSYTTLKKFFDKCDA